MLKSETGTVRKPKPQRQAGSGTSILTALEQCENNKCSEKERCSELRTRSHSSQDLSSVPSVHVGHLKLSVTTVLGRSDSSGLQRHWHWTNTQTHTRTHN